MDNKKSYLTYPLIIMIIFIIATVCYAEDVKLKAHHIKNDMTCTDCHATMTPNEEPDEKSCLNCHGSRQDIMKLTEAMEVNPHFGHEDGLTCTSCHKEHEVSVLYCDDCHQWGMTTP